jgi:putative transposase
MLLVSGIAKRRKQYGAEQTRQLLLQRGFLQLMSRAGTPTDNGYTERFVGAFKLAVAERRPYRMVGAFLGAAQAWINCYNQLRPHKGLGNVSPQNSALAHSLGSISPISLM